MRRHFLNGLRALLGLRCRDAIRLSARGLDAPLSGRERAFLALHDCLCEGCRHYRHQIQQLRKWMRGMDGAAPAPFQLPPRAAETMKARLAMERAISCKESSPPATNL